MGLNPAVVGDHGNPDDKTIKWFNERFNAEKNFFIERYFSPQKEVFYQ